jgi:ferric-dicitrate binding protein FerR (iron transport regulator)
VKSHLLGWDARARRAVVMLAAVAAALLIVASAVAGTRGSEKGSSQADRLRAIGQQRTKALVDADIATARKLMAGDYQGINPAG